MTKSTNKRRDRADRAMLNEARTDDFVHAAKLLDKLDDRAMTLVERRLFQLSAAVMRERAAALDVTEAPA